MTVPPFSAAPQDAYAEQTSPRPRFPKPTGPTLLAIIAAVAVVAAATFVIQSPLSDADEFADPFDGAGVPLERSVALPWTVVAGAFEQRDGSTGAAMDKPLPAIAVVDAPSPNGELVVRLASATSGSGLLFRYHDEANHWRVTYTPEFATWVVVKLADGEPRFMANTGAFGSRSAEVSVRMEDESIQVYLDGGLAAMITDPTFATSPTVGLYVDGSDAAAAADRTRFESFSFRRLG